MRVSVDALEFVRRVHVSRPEPPSRLHRSPGFRSVMGEAHDARAFRPSRAEDSCHTGAQVEACQLGAELHGPWLRRSPGELHALPSSCDNARVCRLRSLIIAWVLGGSTVLMLTSTSALASTSGAQLWTALGGNVTCGIAIHPPNTPPMQLLCSARPVPAPKAMSVGDPGFVFLGSVGRPSLARLSQDSFVGSHPVALRGGSKWGGIGPISVTCTISRRAVRCTNRSRHGFVITRNSYRAF